MRSRGEHRLYIVEDANDEHFEPTEIEVTPIALEDADDMAEAVVKYTDDEEIQFYKDFLTEKGISYHWNTGIEKLKKLYEENL